MPMAERITMNKIQALFQIVVFYALPAPCQSIVWVCVVWEYVYIASAKVVKVLALDERCGGILYLSEWKWVVWVILCTYKLKLLGQPFVTVGNKLLIVWTWHGHIEVIIPWDKSFVAYGTNHCSSAYAIAKSMFLAYLVEFQ